MSSASSILFVSNFLSTANLNRGYSEELADRMESLGWNVIRTSSRRAKLARLADMLATTWNERANYRAAHVDVFSGHAFVWAEAVCSALRRLRKPYVLTLRGGNLPEFARRWPSRVARLLGSAAVVTVPSRYLQEQLQSLRGDLVLVPNAIDAAAYRFRCRARPSPRLVWVRAFHAIYNPSLAIDVLAELLRHHREAELKMLGPDKDGSLAAVLRRANELGVQDRLTVVGRVPKHEVPGHIDSADIFVNTTDVDNTPVSVLEAMASGLCVVSTAVGGIPYLLEDETNALLVPPRNPLAMTTAIERVLRDSALAERISLTAHQRARECDWTNIMVRWQQILGSL